LLISGSANRLRDVLGRETSSSESGLAQVTSASLDHMLCTGKEVSRMVELDKEYHADNNLARDPSTLTAKCQRTISIE
jgi:hypothetical protein